MAITVILCLVFIQGFISSINANNFDLTEKNTVNNVEIQQSLMNGDIAQDLPVQISLTFSQSPMLNKEVFAYVSLTSNVTLEEVTARLLLPSEIYSNDLLNWSGALQKGETQKLTFSVVASETGTFLVQAVATSESLGYLGVCSAAAYVSAGTYDHTYLSSTIDSDVDTNVALKISNNDKSGPSYSVDAAGTLTVYGYWYYYDKDNNEQPIRYARVELWDEDLLFDVKLATTYTGSDGYYQFSAITNDDGLTESGYDIYVKVYCDSDLEVYVTDSLGSNYAWITPKFDDVPDGNYNMGGWVATGSNRGCFGIYDSVIDEFWWLYNRVTWYRSEIQVRWPCEDWPHSHGNWIDLPTSANGMDCAWDNSLVYHEYAHCIHYTARGGSFPPGSGGSHYIDSETNTGFALTEGWAEFMECAVSNDPLAIDPTYRSLSLESTIFADGLPFPFVSHGDIGDWDGNIVEGAVANVLWDMFDGTSSSDHPYFSGTGDYVNGQFSNFWTIFLNNDPDSINQVWGAWNPKDSNLEAIFYNARINQDTTLPIGSISINSGADYTNSPSVTLTLSYSSQVGISQARYSNDGVWDTEPWETPVTSKSWTLNSGDGVKTVYYQIKDNFDIESSTYSDSIVLDTANPSAAIPDDSVSGWSSASARTFTWSAATDTLSGVAGYRWKIGGGVETWTTATSVSIPSQTDGAHIFYVRAQDNAGNLGEYGTHIFQIDTTAPSGSITINSDDAYTASTSVTLTLTFTDASSGVSQVRYSNDGVWDTEPWESPAATKAWTLTSIGGTKIVYYQVKDNAGITSTTLSDTIILDTNNPSTPDPDDDISGWNSANSRTFSWAPSTDTTSGLSGYYWKIDGGAETWTTSTSVFIVYQPDGTHTFYVRAKDAAGNLGEYGAHIFQIDTTAPSGSIIINQGAVYTTSTEVTLTLTYSDALSGVSQIRFNNDGIWDTEPWETPVTSKSWTLNSGDGVKTVYYQIKDNAGLTYTTSDTIILDTTPPTGDITINNGATYTSSASVTLSLSANDALSGIGQMCFSNDNNQWSSWETFATSKAISLQNSDGQGTIYVRYRDNAGLVSTYQSTIVLDTTSPVANAGQPQTVTLGTAVNLNGGASSDANGISSYEWDFDDNTNGNGQTTSHLYANLGDYTVTLTVEDPAGNSAASTVSVTVKPQPTPTPTPTPTQTSSNTSPTSKTSTNSTDAPTLSATPDQSPQTTQTVIAATKEGTAVQLTINGNITESQISNTIISSNQTTTKTIISFTVTGQSGTTGFCNITVPKSIVNYGTSPVVYIDDKPAQEQGYTEDAANYYVWYITSFSSHQIGISFTQANVGASNGSFMSLLPWVAIAVIVLVGFVSAALVLKRKRGAPSQ